MRPPLAQFRVYLRVALWILAIAGTPVAAAGSEARLGEAPRLAVPQQATPGPVQSRATLARSSVVALYRNMYLPQSAVALAWTGNAASCNAGTTASAHQDAVIGRINYFRALAGLPDATLDTVSTPYVQAAALMMSANGMLSHSPPSSWTCFSTTGATGAASANLALGACGLAAIDLYMDDAGGGNAAAGHRRWLLYPPRASFATGDTDGGGSGHAANALMVFGATAARPSTPNGVAWPPAGYVPYQSLPARSGRWSISYPGADFSTATVAVSGPSGALAVTREALANGYGDNTLVFVPSGVSYDAPAGDTSYTVTVNGIGGSGVPTSLQYVVTVIDPAVADEGTPPVTVVEYYHAQLDHYFVTWLPDEIAKLDAGTLAGWVRTGETFRAHATVEAGTSPVCRIYIVPVAGDSHFYGRDATECNATLAAWPQFVLEATPFMALALPVRGVCPAGRIPVYRMFNQRRDANHRYTTNAATRAAMIAAGWIAEGDGDDRVAYCAPS